MATYVSLEKLNELRFGNDPVRLTKLQRWCREGHLAARKIGGEWRVDLEQFDRGAVGPVAEAGEATAEA